MLVSASTTYNFIRYITICACFIILVIFATKILIYEQGLALRIIVLSLAMTLIVSLIVSIFVYKSYTSKKAVENYMTQNEIRFEGVSEIADYIKDESERFYSEDEKYIFTKVKSDKYGVHYKVEKCE